VEFSDVPPENIPTFGFMIIVDEVCFSYSCGTQPALRKISLNIDDNAWITVTGPIGSGKTTLCKVLKGLLEPTDGRVTLVHPHSRFSDVAYLGGDPYDTLVGSSVEEDIVFGMENFNIPPSEMKTRLEQALLWTELSGSEKRLVNTLSGGEQQKLVLAGALAAGARALILDESMNMLDRPVRNSLRALINSLRSDPGLTIIEVTQDLEDIALAERVVFLTDGHIVFDGEYSDFVLHPSGDNWTRAGWGIAGLERELGVMGVTLSYCPCNSRPSECLFKITKK
jgi:energy-coupling factor transporter ATP-binding protein EcfA2